MIPAAHQTMLAPPALPYDAEVEYLDSTGLANNGGPYVSTGIIPNPDDFTFTIDWTPFAVNRQEPMNGIAGATTNGRASIGMATPSGNTLYWGINNLNIYGSIPWTSGTRLVQWLHIAGNSATYGYNTTTLSASVNRYDNNYKPVFIFARNNYPEAEKPAINRYQTTRVYSCQIENGGVLVRDYIPVRVGSGSSAVGYLYDRVSGTLFGNAGTGAFVVGPDKNGA